MKKEKVTTAFVYCIINTINQKRYIGITTNLHKRWLRHKASARLKPTQLIHLAIRKYGDSSFLFIELEKCNSWESACQREVFYIEQLKRDGYQLYNETNGGEGSLGVRRFGSDNPNFGQQMKPHVKEVLLSIRRKLTNEQINEIKVLYATNEYTQTQLAERFNMSLTQIHRIVHSKSWGDKRHDELLTKRNITFEQANEIRQLYLTKQYTQIELGKKFNLSNTQICRIISGQRWKKTTS